MEVLNIASTKFCFHSTNSHWIHKEKTSDSQISCLIFANGCFSPRPFFTKKSRSEVNDRKLVISEAKKKKKDDFHSFAVNEDEATGPFPEAVLLKEKKVQEDGRVLPEFADDEEEKLFEFLNLQMESDLNLKEMRHYEVVYLIHEDHKEEVGAVNTKVEDFIKEKKGKVWRFSDWGMRRLAYKIKKAKNAHYILMNFELEASLINDFKTLLDKDERVIRHLVIKRDNAITEKCIPPPEFHTLNANMDDNDEDDDEEEDEEDYDDEEEEEDDEDVIIVDDSIDEEEQLSEGSILSTRKPMYA